MTDQPKYTPGTWVANLNEIHEVRDAEGGRICILTQLRGKFGLLGRRFDGESEANARLIAAAPDLLEALKDAVRWLEGMSRDNPEFIQDSMPVNCLTMEEMKLAIAKAEGDSKE